MKETKIHNIIIHHMSDNDIHDNTIQLNEKFKVTFILDNVTEHFYKLHKISIDKKESDILLTFYSEVTKISCNILLPENKEVLLIINDSFWL